MFKVNLKKMLLLSLESDKVLHERKRVTIGKERYSIIYDLVDEELFIRKIKHMTSSEKLEKRLHKRREFLIRSQRKMKFNARNLAAEQEAEVDEALTEIIQLASVAVESRKCNASTQTEVSTIDSSNDTFDLVRKMSQCQQTKQKPFDTQGTQTLPPDVSSVKIQAVCENFVMASQTDPIMEKSKTQTEWNSAKNCCYYLQKIIEFQQSHSVVLEHIDALIANICTIMDVNGDLKLYEITTELRETKHMVESFMKNLARHLTRRDKKHLIRFFEEAIDAATANGFKRELYISEISARGTQTDLPESKSHSTQTKRHTPSFSCFGW